MGHEAFRQSNAWTSSFSRGRATSPGPLGGTSSRIAWPPGDGSSSRGAPGARGGTGTDGGTDVGAPGVGCVGGGRTPTTPAGTGGMAALDDAVALALRARASCASVSCMSVSFALGFF